MVTAGARLQGLVSRRIEDVAASLADEPVLALQGPRAVGKTTLLRALAATHDTAVIDLDDLETRDAVAADPAIFVSAPAPVCIDSTSTSTFLSSSTRSRPS